MVTPARTSLFMGVAAASLSLSSTAVALGSDAPGSSTVAAGMGIVGLGFVVGSVFLDARIGVMSSVATLGASALGAAIGVAHTRGDGAIRTPGVPGSGPAGA